MTITAGGLLLTEINLVGRDDLRVIAMDVFVEFLGWSTEP